MTNEAIEVHLNYLRSGFDTMQAALPVLRDKIDQLSAKVDTKIDALSERTSTRIDALNRSLAEQGKETNARIDVLNTSLTEKIDSANKERAAGDAGLGTKIDKLSERVLEMQGTQKGLIWFLSSISLLAAGTSIAHTFDLI
ncbi:MAG: hypothetical protein WDO56_36265 [Gammaproteobacteria bacterium]